MSLLRVSDLPDSKALSADTRQMLWESFDANADLCYSSATLSPQAISANMLRRVPINLNRQAEEATMSLIRSALNRGINIREVG
jgi:ribonuclease H2 subunit A